MQRLILAIPFLLASVFSGVQAQEPVPKTIGYTGYLTGASGEAVADGEHEFTFRL